MVFSSNLFLFAFLPLVLCIHLILPKKLRNLFIFIASLSFYLWGSGPTVFLLLLSIIANYFISLGIDRSPSKRRALFAIAVVGNLSLLFYFKYLNFVADQLSNLAVGFGASSFHLNPILLPIGISFFTFQAISYLGEVYRKEQRPARSLIDYGMYISFFPHLIAGPIVRFSDISAEIRSRHVGVDDLFEGLWRFALGLGKKVIIANRLGAVADQIFALPNSELAPSFAWIGVVAYTIQIYFDFSGYSDMAIGLARMFGFRFPENFNQPYRAQSVTEFWRRWHMTLSRWFRDFVYIPLGGNRHGAFRTSFNLWAVFFLCGLWHGAAWTFIIWGIYHGVLLVTERILRNRLQIESKGIFGCALTLFLVMIGWILFRANSFSQATEFLAAMFGMNRAYSPSTMYNWGYYLQPDVLFLAGIALFFSWLPVERLPNLYNSIQPFYMTVTRSAVALILVTLCAAALSTAAFNPFIYFRF